MHFVCPIILRKINKKLIVQNLTFLSYLFILNAP